MSILDSNAKTNGFPSAVEIAQVRAVLAALTELQRHVRSYKYTDQVDADQLNSILEMLPIIRSHDWENLHLASGTHWQANFLMRLDAAVALLTSLVQSWQIGSGVPTIEASGIVTIDGEFIEDKKQSRGLNLIKGK